MRQRILATLVAAAMLASAGTGFAAPPAKAGASAQREKEQRRRMQVGPIPTRQDGTADGYIADAQPLGYASYAEVVKMLEREGKLEPNTPPGTRIFVRADGLDVTHWTLFDRGWPFAPSLTRQRLVTDGRNVFMFTRGLCEAPQRSQCAQFEALIKTMPRQTPRPPLPPL